MRVNLQSCNSATNATIQFSILLPSTLVL
uniref:Uncharacterized protein n=1 Tax=Anguilla anguilla TaxID=7936 RepID=A0A0E9T1H5_ANGAN